MSWAKNEEFLSDDELFNRDTSPKFRFASDQSNLPDFKLNRAENPYKIKHNLDENETLLRNIRYILNKLTPTNLNKLTFDFINLPINTQVLLEGSIDLIFEKSINEEMFSTTYAQLCKALSSIT